MTYDMCCVLNVHCGILLFPSALSFAHGLFEGRGPLNGYQPITLEMSPPHSDTLLRFFEHCPLYMSMKEKGVSKGCVGGEGCVWEVRDVRGEVRDVRGEVRDVRGEVRDVRGEVRDVRGEVRDVRGEVRDVRGEVRMCVVR